MKNKIHTEHVDIRELLESIGINYRESGKNIGKGWLGIESCPYCGTGNFHIGIHISTKAVSCWKCGEPKHLLSYLTKELGSFQSALEVVKKFIPRELKLEKQMERVGVETVELPKNSKPGLSKYHKAYLTSRGFNPDFLVEEYGLSHVGPVGKYSNRIIVPVIKNYRLLTYTTVDIAPTSECRYIHCPEEESIFPMKGILYNEDKNDKTRIMAVEGLFDSWRMGPGCTPTWGVKFTPEQKARLAKYRRVVLIGDGDKEGWKFNIALGNELAAFCEVIYFKLEAGVDPDQFTEEEIQYIRRA